MNHIIMLPLRENVPNPRNPDWKAVTCPVCGADCWQTAQARQLQAVLPGILSACTPCALRGRGGVLVLPAEKKVRTEEGGDGMEDKGFTCTYYGKPLGELTDSEFMDCPGPGCVTCECCVDADDAET